MTACEPLCAPLAGGVETLPLPGGFEPVWAAVRRFVKGASALLLALRRTKEKAAGYVFVKQKIFR